MVINSNSPHYNGGIEIIRYTICKPGGNDTALVYGTDYTSNKKKSLIMQLWQDTLMSNRLGLLI